MQSRSRCVAMGTLVFGSALLLVGCSVAPVSQEPAASPSIQVSGPTVVIIGASAQYTASAQGLADTNVVWQVNGTSGGSPQTGTINNTGTFTSPSVLPQPATISIGAVDTSSGAASTPLLITLQMAPAISVTVSGPATVNLGSPAQYTATLTGSSSQTVAWSVNGLLGGSATYGTITSAGLYSPPAMVPSVNGIVITATTAGSPPASGTLGATILDPVPLIGAASASTQDGRTYLIDVRGSNFLTGATLAVSGQVAVTVSVSQTDLQTTIAYPTVQTLSVAVTVQNPSPGATQSAPVIVSAGAPSATMVSVTGLATINVGGTIQYAATVVGQTDQSVVWAVNGIIGGNATYGTILPSGLYTSPTSVPTSNVIAITAASNAVPTAVGSLSATLSNPVPIVFAAVPSTTDGKNYLIDIRGSNFISGAMIVLGSQSLNTVSVSQNDLQTTISYPTVQPLAVTINVVNPNPGVTESAPINVTENAPSATGVTVSGSTSVSIGNQSQYSAMVLGVTDQTVTWAVNSIVGGNATYGTISASGLYTAPPNVPAANNVVISATSNVSPSISGAFGTSILDPVPFITAATASTNDGKTYLIDVRGTGFLAGATLSVSGQPATTVTVSQGDLQTTVVYPTVQNLSVVVRVQNPNPGATQSAPVNVSKSAPSATTVSVTGPTVINVGSAVQPVQYLAVVAGLTDQTVTWAVNGTVGGNSEFGTISASGLYTAPSIVPAVNTVVITASSTASPAVSGSLDSVLLNPVPLVTSGTATTTDGKSYLIDVRGSSFISGAKLLISGQTVATIAASQNDLQTTVTFAAAQALAVTVNVLNPDPGATQSGSINVVKSAPAATGVSVTGPVNINVGAAVQPIQFAAVVSGVTDQTVTWSVNGSIGGNSSYGTISTSGLYSPPASVPAVNTLVISAASTVSQSVTGWCNTTLLNPVPIIVAAQASTTDGKNYLIDVRGTSFVAGAKLLVGGQPVTTVGISLTDLQTTISFATAQALAVTVNVANPDPGATQSAPANVTATVPIPSVVTVTGPSKVNVGGTGLFGATLSGTQSQGVTWSVNGTIGGSSTFGTIANDGTYTPPTSVPAVNGIFIAATSADGTSSNNFKVTILDVVPFIGNASAWTLDGGFTYFVDVPGTDFLPGANLLINGQPVTTTTVSQNDLQTTIVYSSPQALQVAAVVQNPNPGATQSASVNISAPIPTATATAAGRFLDQATFGPTATTIAHVQQIGLAAALAEQFNRPTTLFSEPPPSPQPQCVFQNYICTQSEFLNVTVWGNDQLRQRVAMALSEIWVAPVLLDNQMPFYLNVLANDAFTNYRTIMQDVTLTANMGAYLNMVNSGAPPAGQIANENFGREMMQLFTMGLNLLNSDGSMQVDSQNNPIPAYSELQVEAFARAYTGWTYANADGSTPTAFNYSTNGQHFMVPVESQHDMSQKILLNGTTLPAGQTAEQDLAGAVDNIFAHPNVGPFVCRQLIQHLVTSAPSPSYVQRVATIFADNGSGVRGDMKAVITAILMDQEARAEDIQTGDQMESSPANNGGHLREPLLWTMNLLRALNAVQPDGSNPYPYVTFMGNLIGATGEMPFSQTSVFNYFSPQYFIPQTSLNAPEFQIESTSSVVPRSTLANYIIHNVAYAPLVDLSATSIFGQKASDPAALADYLSLIFMHSQMPTDMRSALITEISSIPAFDPQSRVEVAVYLVVTSAQYKVIN